MTLCTFPSLCMLTDEPAAQLELPCLSTMHLGLKKLFYWRNLTDLIFTPDPKYFLFLCAAFFKEKPVKHIFSFSIVRKWFLFQCVGLQDIQNDKKSKDAHDMCTICFYMCVIYVACILMHVKHTLKFFKKKKNRTYLS